MATLLPEGKQSFTKSDGTPLVGGKLYTYEAGTSTPKATYADAAGTVPNTNPVILDARGEATIYWSGSYKVALKDAGDVLVWTVDQIEDMSTQLASANGASMVGYQPSGTGAVTTDVQSKLRSLELADYAALRAFTGEVSHVQIVAEGIAGLFIYDESDTTSADNGGTVLVDASGRRWKRVYDGAVDVCNPGSNLGDLGANRCQVVIEGFVLLVDLIEYRVETVG